MEEYADVVRVNLLDVRCMHSDPESDERQDNLLDVEHHCY